MRRIEPSCLHPKTGPAERILVSIRHAAQHPAVAVSFLVKLEDAASFDADQPVMAFTHVINPVPGPLPGIDDARHLPEGAVQQDRNGSASRIRLNGQIRVLLTHASPELEPGLMWAWV